MLKQFRKDISLTKYVLFLACNRTAAGMQLNCKMESEVKVKKKKK